MKLAIASDHAGFELKERLKKSLAKAGHLAVDFGTFSAESCDYPDFAKAAARAVSQKKYSRAVLVCGTGQGMAMAANKFKGVRAAVCESLFCARMSRSHNDSNILCLGSRVLDSKKAVRILKEWLKTGFDGGRHLRRLKKIG